jgi:hypothetical protein
LKLSFIDFSPVATSKSNHLLSNFREIALEIQTSKQRLDILQSMASDMRINSQSNLIQYIAGCTTGFSASDLKRVFTTSLILENNVNALKYQKICELSFQYRSIFGIKISFLEL